MQKKLVNPIALQNCLVKTAEVEAPVLDISFVRVVVEAGEATFTEGQTFAVELVLDRYRFSANAVVKGKGDGWTRLGLERMLPSARAHMRSFLSPKKIGESLLEDWRRDNVRHFHGLNESELWFDPDGGVLFTYLDQSDFESQFLIRMTDKRGPLQVGKILRKDYMELNRIDSELPMLPLTDREVYAKLGECRDIVTNFRPTGQLEYHLKQRLLKVISETLYSTSHRVEMSQIRSSRTTNMSVDA